MGARQKLNEHHIVGALGVAAIVGALGQSWMLFVAVAATLIAADLYSGKIRPDKDNCRQ
jgi:hypothetical protein